VTVYVDGIAEYGDVAKRNGLRTTQWAHLVADTPEELHTFAERIGLRRSWFQNADNYRWHYDVTPAKRTAAIKAGAVEIDRRKLAEIMAQRRAGRKAAATPSPPASVLPGEPERAPLAAPIFGNAGGWAVVMKRAGDCCQCTGQCGATHRKTEGRCDARHGAYGGKGHPPIRLEAAPEDPTTPEHTAARMTPDQLMAWCAPCRSGAAKKAKPPQGRKIPAQSEALFDMEGLG
jgi:hypothetical protein